MRRAIVILAASLAAGIPLLAAATSNATTSTATPGFICQVVYESSGEQARKASLYILAAVSITLNMVLLWKLRSN